jgi:hypothetical protein
MSTHQFQPDLPPPSNTVGAVGWMRKNLFNGPIKLYCYHYSRLLSIYCFVEHRRLGVHQRGLGRNNT